MRGQPPERLRYLVSEWPDLFIVGAARAGTMSLWRYLGQHPEIYMAPVKEPNFFSQVEAELGGSILDEGAYLRLFARAAGARVRGEASVSYLWHKEAPGRIKGVSPGAKILISLREPVDRAYSVYWHRVRNGLERRSFVAAIEEELIRERTGAPARYVGRGSMYAENVRRYLRTFPGAVHVLFFEELVEDVRSEVRKTFEFVGVDPTFAERLAIEAHNRFALPRNPATRRVLGSRTARAFGRLVVPRPIRPRIEKLLTRRVAQPSMGPEMRESLIELYCRDVALLAELVGREPPWPAFRHGAARSSSVRGTLPGEG